MSPQAEKPAPQGAVTAPAPDDGPTAQPPRPERVVRERQVHEPHRVGLPPLGAYVAELWRRREFAFEMSRTDLRAQHFNTVFGQLWLVINPLLLACVYFILVDILQAGSRGTEFFAHLMAGLFAYHFVSDAVRQGAKSVVSGGRLILNTAFPRALLPLSSVMTAFMRFVPTLVIYAPVHVASGLPIDLRLLWVLPVVALLAVLASGVAMLVAAAQVYFRDISSFLPYVLRVWLYASPVLYYAHEVPERYQVILDVNPIAPLLTTLSDVLNRGEAPSAQLLGTGLAWAAGIFVVGSLFFISREREFAVRL
jgi:teichoic acid transport system permease protein